MEFARVNVLRENSSMKSHRGSSSALCATPHARAARYLQMIPAANHAKKDLDSLIRESAGSSVKRMKFGLNQVGVRFVSPNATVVWKKLTLALSTLIIS